MILLYILKKNP